VFHTKADRFDSSLRMAAGYLSSLNGQAMSTHGLNASNSLSASTPLSSKAPICLKYLS